MDGVLDHKRAGELIANLEEREPAQPTPLSAQQRIPAGQRQRLVPELAQLLPYRRLVAGVARPRNLAHTPRELFPA